jgi:hypothetical protein
MRPQAILLRLSEVLPRHWTSADPNGARRWGLSFGAGLLLFALVGAFVVYAVIDDQDAGDAWTRPSADGIDRIHRLNRADESDRSDLTKQAERDTASASAAAPRRDATSAMGSSSSFVEPTARVARGEVRPPTVPASPYKEPTAEHPPRPTAAQSAGAAKHPHGRTVRHRARHPPRYAPHAPVPRTPDVLFTLPHFWTEPMRMPVFPHPPSDSFDLSDNQRALYRGH